MRDGGFNKAWTAKPNYSRRRATGTIVESYRLGVVATVEFDCVTELRSGETEEKPQGRKKSPVVASARKRRPGRWIAAAERSIRLERDLPRLRLGLLGEREAEDAVLELGLDVLGVDAFGEGEDAFEATDRAAVEDVLAAFDGLALGLDGQDAVMDGDLEGVLVRPGRSTSMCAPCSSSQRAIGARVNAAVGAGRSSPKKRSKRKSRRLNGATAYEVAAAPLRRTGIIAVSPWKVTSRTFLGAGPRSSTDGERRLMHTAGRNLETNRSQ